VKRLTILLAAIALISITASGQDWAKGRLEKYPHQMEWVKVKYENSEVICFIAFPEVKENAAAVVH
jgi:hypothetical protein